MFSTKSLTTLSTLVACGAMASWSPLFGEESTKDPGQLHEPVYRVTKQERLTKTATTSLVAPTADVATRIPRHPLDSALEAASSALQKCHDEVRDYTGILVKRERVSGRLRDPEYMLVKVRHELRAANQQVQAPFSVYLKFIKPAGLKGREVIYVKGRNNNKLIAHEGGFKGRFTPSIHLDPNGTLAMMGQRYPITDIGIQNLCEKLLERGTRDRKMGPCQVMTRQKTINKRPATRIEVIHPEPKPHLDFHVARIYVDDEFGLPVRYEAYDWPRKAGAPPSQNELIEEYTYVKLRFNVGLTDLDFDPKNPNYNMD